jgi:uncharacterized protein YecT (DUF1311 family)
MFKQALLALLIVAPMMAQAAPVDNVKRQLSDCMDKAPSNMDMKMCASDALDAADRLLNKDYQAIVADLKKQAATEKADEVYGGGTKEILARLKQAQLAWINYRDANCSLVSIEALGGTGESLSHSMCTVDMTLSRVTELNSIIGSTKN